MKTMKFLSLAALALTFAACSSDDNELTQLPAEQPANNNMITITAKLAPKSGSAQTRAMNESGGNIVVDWDQNEQLQIISANGHTATANIDAVDGSGVATISFTIDAAAVGQNCTIVYPASAATTTGVKAYADNAALTAQDGTLKYDIDVRVGAGTISVSDPGTMTVTTQPEAQNAIFKFTLSGQSIDATHPLVIKKGENDVVTTVTPASSTTSVYVAMPPAASSTYRFIVNSDDNKYIKSGTAAITAGNYYQTPLDLSTARYPLALSSATVDDLGSVIGADGKIYLNMTAATGASPATTAVAMIAYKSETAGESLAIQLNASPASMNWSAACSYSSYPSITGNPGTWRLPSKADWQNMFVGCAKSGDAGAGDNITPIAGFKEKIGATGITWKSSFYWSFTDSGSNAWSVGVYLSGKMASASFVERGTSNSCSVLGCLAF